MATNKTENEQRQWLNASLKAKRRTLEQYTEEIQRLEAKAANLRNVAKEIERGIARTELVIRRIGRTERNKHAK